MKSSQAIITPRTESMLQYILFAILVVATPFIVVTKYLQGVAHIASHWSFSIFGHSIPYLLTLAIAIFIALMIKYRKQIFIPRRIIAILFCFLLISIAHWVQDLYMRMSFFDMQQNWHYFAYGAYVFFFFRAFNARNMPKNKMILYAFLSTICMSTFDETFQFFMSNRVFDISDIAKDALGSVIGLILVLFVTETYGTIQLNLKTITKKKAADYLRDPLSALVTVFILAMSFVIISPLLTDHENWHLNLISSFSAFFLVMIVIHYSQYRTFRYVFFGFMFALLLALGVSYGFNYKKNITHYSHGLTIYKGIPFPFFDILIYPNGTFRLVDKKHHFRSQDKLFFLEQEPDILLFGSGSLGRGGKGFGLKEGTIFLFNRFTKRCTQLIILPTPDACRKYNELKEAGKNVLFVIHNTC